MAEDVSVELTKLRDRAIDSRDYETICNALSTISELRFTVKRLNERLTPGAAGPTVQPELRGWLCPRCGAGNSPRNLGVCLACVPDRPAISAAAPSSPR